MIIKVPGKLESGRRLLTAKPQTVRHLNRATVLDLIRQHQPLSRADLARRTGMHLSNISLIVEGLQKAGLLREERGKKTGPGRTPILISLARGTAGVIGASLGQNRTALSFATLDGHVENSYTFETPESAEDFVEAMAEAIAAMTCNLDSSGTTSRSVLQVVLGIPGIVTHRSDEVSLVWTPALPHYSGQDLAALIQKRTGLPTTIDNNAGLGAMVALRSAEKSQDRDVSNFVFLGIGDFGVGSGMVIQRNLYSGYDTVYTGEVGHIVVDHKGLQCKCGRRGCWQLYICDSAIWKRYNPRLPFTQARFSGFLDEAAAGKPKALAAIRTAAEYLSLGISNVALTLNPKRIMLAGSLVRIWPVLEKELKSAFFLPHHYALIQPMQVPVDTLFLAGAVERAFDIVFSASKA